MIANHLRIYCGPAGNPISTDVVECECRRNSVTVPLTEVLPLLADAFQSERTWLRDFSGDEVTISSDLYEVLMAYQHYRRPSA